jgi:hypothetical protein
MKVAGAMLGLLSYPEDGDTFPKRQYYYVTARHYIPEDDLFFFGTRALIWALAYLHEIFRFTSVY